MPVMPHMLWSPLGTLLSPGVRFLLLNQFYPPDGAPTGRMLHDLAKVLVSRGHEVRVICSRLGYDGTASFKVDEISDGVQVVRTGGIRFRRTTAAGRVAAYAAFLAGALRAALRGTAPDRVVSLTTPPFLGLAGSLVARLRRSRHVHWTMDVYPDALRAHWRVAANRMVWRGFEWLGRMQFRGSALVVAPGSYVERCLQRYVSAETPVRSVPLWATDGMNSVDVVASARERTARGWNPDDLIFMYSGNMGLGHRFAEFLEAARQLGSGGPKWVFVGDGARRGEIETFRTANPSVAVELRPLVDGSKLAESLASADVHLVSVAPGWEGIMVPSKLQNAFAVGRPVIFLGPTATESATWVRESGGGWVVTPGDVPAMLRAIAGTRDRSERLRRGQAALEYARVHFDRERNCNLIADLLEGNGKDAQVPT
jgi:colanic acid biosynthesis glycosyl transferase WcaI